MLLITYLIILNYLPENMVDTDYAVWTAWPAVVNYSTVALYPDPTTRLCQESVISGCNLAFK